MGSLCNAYQSWQMGLAKFQSNFTDLAVSFFQRVCAPCSLIFYMKVSRTLQSQNVFGSQRKTLVSSSHNNFQSAPLSLKSVNLLTCILGHNSNLEEGVMLGSFYTGYQTHINLFHTSFHVSLSHQHSTTVSFETKLSYILSWFSSVYHSIELLKLLYCKF